MEVSDKLHSLAALPPKKLTGKLGLPLGLSEHCAGKATQHVPIATELTMLLFH